MKKILLLVPLLAVVVLTVSARRSWKPGKHGPKKLNGCQLQNCNRCHSKPFSCEECDHGFVKEKVPLGYACRKTCSPGLFNVHGTCVEKRDCPQKCKTCQNRLNCSVCEHGHALYKGFFGTGRGVCMKNCPKGHKTKVNPMGGNECARHCTANCETCRGRTCSVCEDGHVLYKGFGGFGFGRCLQKCPKGYKTETNPSGGNKCVKHCTANCETCRGRTCSVCEDGYVLYKGFGGFGFGRCLQQCPKGYKTETNPSGGNKCVKQCAPNCKTCQNRFSCSICENGYALYNGFFGQGNGRCLTKCPRGYKTVMNKCVKQCNPNCKKCQNGLSCSVCEYGYALHKGITGLGNGRCITKCPRGFKTKINPTGGNKCVKQCRVTNCESCPSRWDQQNKCTRCESGFYRLSVGTRPWQQHDFCFSHCPAGYGPTTTVAGVAECQQKPDSSPEPANTPEPTTEPEPTTAEEPVTEPVTEPDSWATSEPTTIPEPITEPEPTTIFTDFWP